MLSRSRNLTLTLRASSPIETPLSKQGCFRFRKLRGSHSSLSIFSLRTRLAPRPNALQANVSISAAAHKACSVNRPSVTGWSDFSSHATHVKFETFSAKYSDTFARQFSLPPHRFTSLSEGIARLSPSRPSSAKRACPPLPRFRMPSADTLLSL